MSPYIKGILERILLVVAIALVLWGWKWTSIGVAPYNVQDDGYNVTGGFLMFFGGALIGRFLALKLTWESSTKVKDKK